MTKKKLNLLIQKSAFKERFNQLIENVSTDELITITGASYRTVCHWKNGDYLPRLNFAQKLAIHFNVSVDWLLGEGERI